MRRTFDAFAPAARKSRPVPFDFVLEQLASLSPYTKPMFGCTGVYVDERIVMVLRDRGDSDDGVWLAYDPHREDEVLSAFPSLAPIDVFQNKVRGWRKLGAKDDDFESEVMRACALIRQGDTRFGKVPKARKLSKPRKAPKAQTKAPQRKKASVRRASVAKKR